MGLDMYLKKKLFIGGNYDHRKVQGGVNLTIMAGTKHEEMIELPATEVSEIVLDGGYWRKANQIHNWFVTNIQEGRDECQPSYVPNEKLIELRTICQLILKAKADNSPDLKKLIEEKLPPSSGFFFGSTDVDEYYFQDLEHTVQVLEKIDDKFEYEYQSSW